MKKLLSLSLVLGALAACTGGTSAPDSGGGSSSGGGPTDPDAGLTTCQRYVKHLEWGNFASHSECWFQNYTGTPNAAASTAAISTTWLDFNFDNGYYDSDLCYRSTVSTHIYIKGDVQMDAPWKVPAANGGDSNGVFFRNERFNSDKSRLGAYWVYNNSNINDAQVPCDLINYDVRVRRLYNIGGTIVEGEDIGYLDSTPDVWGNCRIVSTTTSDIGAYTIKVTSKLAYGSRYGYGPMFDTMTYKDYLCPFYAKVGGSEALTEKAKEILADARKEEGISDDTIPQKLRHASAGRASEKQATLNDQRLNVKVEATKESQLAAIAGRSEAKGAVATSGEKKSGAALKAESKREQDVRNVFVREEGKLVDQNEVIENTSAEQYATKKVQQEQAAKAEKK